MGRCKIGANYCFLPAQGDQSLQQVTLDVTGLQNMLAPRQEY